MPGRNRLFKGKLCGARLVVPTSRNVPSIMYNIPSMLRMYTLRVLCRHEMQVIACKTLSYQQVWLWWLSLHSAYTSHSLLGFSRNQDVNSAWRQKLNALHMFNWRAKRAYIVVSTGNFSISIYGWTVRPASSHAGCILCFKL